MFVGTRIVNILYHNTLEDNIVHSKLILLLQSNININKAKYKINHNINK